MSHQDLLNLTVLFCFERSHNFFYRAVDTKMSNYQQGLYLHLCDAIIVAQPTAVGKQSLLKRYGGALECLNSLSGKCVMNKFTVSYDPQ